MTRIGPAFVLAAALSVFPHEECCPAYENDAKAVRADSPDFPVRLLPSIDGLERQLILSYGASRPVLQRRVQYTLDVVAAWQRSGRTPGDEALLGRWIHDAVERSLPGRREPLPSMPGFTAPSESLTSPAAGKDARTTVEEAATFADRRPGPHHGEPPLPLVLKPPAARTGNESGPVPAIAETPPRVGAVPGSLDLAAPAIDDGPSAVVIPAVKNAGREGREPIEPPVMKVDDSPSGPPPKAAVEVATPPSVSARGPALEHMTDASPSDPRSAVANLRPDAPDQPVAVELNLREYAARHAGHRLGLRRLEALLNESKNPTADELGELVAELENLTGQAAFLALYAQLLPVEVRDAYGQLTSARDVSDTLRKAIADRRDAMRDGVAGGGSSTSRERELRELARLTDRLERLADMNKH